MSETSRVLLVEDEFLLAQATVRALRSKGWAVVGPAATVAAALALLDEEAIDCAVLDINLVGETVLPVADALRERAIPYLFLSGYSRIPAPRHDGVTLLIKPVRTDALMTEIAAMLSRPSELAE